MELGRIHRAFASARTALGSDHAFVSAAFVINRAILHRAGMRLNFILDWMHQADPEDLRTRLFDTLYFAHAFPPGMNLLTGLVFKTSQSHAPGVAYAMLYASGLVLVNSLFYLCRVSGLSAAAATVVSVAFSLLPQTIYFEHLYLYTYPTAALLSVAAVLFHRAVERRSFWSWTAFFTACAAIGWIRSTFHLVWFVAMFGLAVLFVDPADRRRLALSALGPGLVLFSLYLKNLLVFGVFGAMTFGSGNLTTVTIRRLAPEVRDAWISEGKLSALASVDVFAGPRAYLPYFETSQNDKWPPTMNRLENPTTGAPNYNHWFFLEMSGRGDRLGEREAPVPTVDGMARVGQERENSPSSASPGARSLRAAVQRGGALVSRRSGGPLCISTARHGLGIQARRVARSTAGPRDSGRGRPPLLLSRADCLRRDGKQLVHLRGHGTLSVRNRTHDLAPRRALVGRARGAGRKWPPSNPARHPRTDMRGAR